MSTEVHFRSDSIASPCYEALRHEWTNTAAMKPCPAPRFANDIQLVSCPRCRAWYLRRIRGEGLESPESSELKESGTPGHFTAFARRRATCVSCCQTFGKFHCFLADENGALHCRDCVQRAHEAVKSYSVRWGQINLCRALEFWPESREIEDD